MDWNLYDKVNYDNGPITTSGTEYANSQFGLDFQNGFKIPTTFVRNVNFRYLSPIGSTYKESRKSKSEVNIYNVMKTYGGIELRCIITGTDRQNLIENLSYFKKKVRNRMNVVIKDAGIERVAKCFVENIDPDENHYNLTYMRVVVTFSFRDYLAFNTNNQQQYSAVTQASKIMNFYNSGLETDYIGVITCSAGSNLDFTISVNGVDLIISGVNSGDTITIDTENIEVIHNGVSIVFGGILCKLEEGDNEIVVSRTGASGTYDFNLFYKTTIS